VSYFIAFFTNNTINFGLAAALATLLLVTTGALVIVARFLVPGFRTGNLKL
jgi:putative spermidine/putrescine transport system permease protein